MIPGGESGRRKKVELLYNCNRGLIWFYRELKLGWPFRETASWGKGARSLNPCSEHRWKWSAPGEDVWPERGSSLQPGQFPGRYSHTGSWRNGRPSPEGGPWQPITMCPIGCTKVSRFSCWFLSAVISVIVWYLLRHYVYRYIFMMDISSLSSFITFISRCHAYLFLMIF